MYIRFLYFCFRVYCFIFRPVRMGVRVRRIRAALHGGQMALARVEVAVAVSHRSASTIRSVSQRITPS